MKIDLTELEVEMVTRMRQSFALVRARKACLSAMARLNDEQYHTVLLDLIVDRPSVSADFKTLFALLDTFDAAPEAPSDELVTK